MRESEKGQWSHLVVSDSVRPHRWQPTRLPSPWDSPGKSTGVGCHCLLQKESSMKVQSPLTNLIVSPQAASAKQSTLATRIKHLPSQPRSLHSRGLKNSASHSELGVVKLSYSKCIWSSPAQSLSETKAKPIWPPPPRAHSWFTSLNFEILNFQQSFTWMSVQQWGSLNIAKVFRISPFLNQRLSSKRKDTDVT